MRCFRLAVVPYDLAGLTKTASSLFLLSIVLMAAVQPLTAQTAPVGNWAQTIAVGDCRPHLVSYTTISAAVAAAAAVPNTYVLVCPGTYPEQVMIGFSTRIGSSLTLQGLPDATGAYPVITVPSGNWASGLTQVSFGFYPGDWTVNISNLVIDGSGSGVDCSSGNLVGIGGGWSDGTLDNVEVRNQNPGGCGIGIYLFEEGSIKVKNCNIHDFDNTGIETWSDDGWAFGVDISSTFVGSESASVQVGISSTVTAGTVSGSVIFVPNAQAGVALNPGPASPIVRGNTIIGANIGIWGEGALISKNSLSNNGTGIVLYSGTATWNTVVSSSAAAFNLDCVSHATVQHNTISDAPISIANIGAGDTVKNNIINDAGAPTMCP